MRRGKMAMWGGLLAALLLAPWQATTARQEDKKADAVPLDLSRLGNYMAMVTVRIGDVWSSGVAKAARQKLGKDADALEAELKKNIGLAPADIERFTLAVRKAEGNSNPVMIISATRGLDQKGIVGLVLSRAKSEKVGQHTIYFRDSQALVFLSDKVYALGNKADVEEFLEEKAGKGGLSGAVQLATRKHTLVVGVNGSALPPLPPAVPADVEPLVPLAKLQSASLTVDLADKVKGQLRIGFGGEKEAVAAKKAFEAGQAMALEFLLAALKPMEKEAKLADIVALLKQFHDTAKAVRLNLANNELTAAMEMPLDEAVTGRTVVELALLMQQAAARAQSANNLKQIGLAMHTYHDTTGTFPAHAVYDANGKALLSWRVLLLPYLEQDQLYKEFKLDEPWDSKHNKKLLEKMPQVYKGGKASQSYGTFYQAFVGKNAAFEGKRGIRLPDFNDGTSNTILVAEASKDVPWSKPDDLDFDADKALPKLGGIFIDGFNALYGDGSVRFMRISTKEATLKALITRNGGEVIPNDD